MNKIIFQIYISNTVNISFRKNFENKENFMDIDNHNNPIGNEISYISRYSFYLICKIKGHTTEY